MSVLVALLVLLAGLMIGAVGIGGVLVVPALTDAAGVPLDQAIAASMAGFLATGLAAVVSRRGGTGRLVAGLWTLNLAALFGAMLGSAIIDLVSPIAIRLFIGAIAIISGLHALLSRLSEGDRSAALGQPALGTIGGVVGCGSALSGTGGPVMLLPILMLLGVPVRTGIAMAQMIQLPIALSATGVNAVQGRLDIGLAALVGSLLVLSNFAGVQLSSRVGTAALKRLVAIGLIALGLRYGYATFSG